MEWLVKSEIGLGKTGIGMWVDTRDQYSRAFGCRKPGGLGYLSKYLYFGHVNGASIDQVIWRFRLKY